MLLNTKGIVIRSIKYGETSLICDIYTQHWGMRSYIIHGVRQAKSKISNLLLRPSALIDLVVYHNEDKKLNNIKEVKPSYIYERLPFSVKHGAIALFMCELLQKTLKEAEANETLFDFLQASFIDLDKSTEIASSFYLIFMAQLSFYLGFGPDVETFKADSVFDYRNGIFLINNNKNDAISYFDTISSQHLVDVYCTPLQEAASLSIPAAQRNKLYENLMDYYSFHIAGIVQLQSYLVLNSIF